MQEKPCIRFLQFLAKICQLGKNFMICLGWFSAICVATKVFALIVANMKLLRKLLSFSEVLDEIGAFIINDNIMAWYFFNSNFHLRRLTRLRRNVVVDTKRLIFSFKYKSSVTSRTIFHHNIKPCSSVLCPFEAEPSASRDPFAAFPVFWTRYPCRSLWA